MPTCPMCNADVEDMDQHTGEAHDGQTEKPGDSSGPQPMPGPGEQTT